MSEFNTPLLLSHATLEDIPIAKKFIQEQKQSSSENQDDEQLLALWRVDPAYIKSINSIPLFVFTNTRTLKKILPATLYFLTNKSLDRYVEDSENLIKTDCCGAVHEAERFAFSNQVLLKDMNLY